MTAIDDDVPDDPTEALSRNDARALRNVATYWRVAAWIAVARMVWALVQPGGVHLLLDLGVLGFFVAPGLLRFSQGWRTVAVVLSMLHIVAVGVLATLILPLLVWFAVLDPERVTFAWDSGEASPDPIERIIDWIHLAMLGLDIYAVLVLERPSVRRAFGLPVRWS